MFKFTAPDRGSWFRRISWRQGLHHQTPEMRRAVNVVFCWPDIPWIITSSSFVYFCILLNYNLLGVIYMLCDGVAEFVYLSIKFNDGIIMVIIYEMDSGHIFIQVSTIHKLHDYFIMQLTGYKLFGVYLIT